MLATVVLAAVVDTLLGLGSAADLLRLVAVPAFAWAAYRDVRTRRIPNRLWPPLVAAGVFALALEFAGGLPPGFEGDVALLRIAVSVGLVAPLGYVFFRVGGFGGADAKAVIALGVLFPLYPVYYLPFDALPVHAATLGVFSLTILTNTVVAGALYPAALAARNLLRGHIAPPMVVGRPAPIETLSTAHGSLMETPEGYTRRGLDLDALRMYLRWRGTTLSALRADPDRHRDPTSVPSPGARNDPGDGAVGDGLPVADGGLQEPEPIDGPTRSGAVRDDTAAEEGIVADDPWGAEAFLDDVEGTAYGTTPRTLREGLEVVADPARETVWFTPGIPFVVPMFVGLVVALTYGDVLFVLLRVLGLLP
ncbi:MAG: prepilin peptidase [Haloarculaceae archaeon]